MKAKLKPRRRRQDKANRRETRGSAALKEAVDAAPNEAKRIGDAIRAHHLSVRRWAWGDRVPGEKYRNALRAMLGIEQADWFLKPEPKARAA